MIKRKRNMVKSICKIDNIPNIICQIVLIKLKILTLKTKTQQNHQKFVLC